MRKKTRKKGPGCDAATVVSIPKQILLSFNSHLYRTIKIVASSQNCGDSLRPPPPPKEKRGQIFLDNFFTFKKRICNRIFDFLLGFQFGEFLKGERDCLYLIQSTVQRLFYSYGGNLIFSFMQPLCTTSSGSAADTQEIGICQQSSFFKWRNKRSCTGMLNLSSCSVICVGK